MTEPLRVYLDSSDFSTLSSSSRSNEQEAIRRALAEWADSGLVQFVFSGTHLIEMAPLAPTYTSAAAARADLLVNLCRQNAVVSYDRLVDSELRSLGDAAAPPPAVFSTTGEWYPKWGTMMSPVQWVEAARQVDDASKEHGLNRQHRRRLKRTLFKGDRPKKATRRFLADNERSSDYAELLENYPMRETDARVLGRYVIGEATAEQANEAFLSSLRDPRWMMRWFANHYPQMTPFIEWLRAPAETLLAAALKMHESARQLHNMRRIVGPSFQPEAFTATSWASLQDEAVCNIAQRAIDHFTPSAKWPASAKCVDERCPGLSAFIRSMHSAIRDTTGETPRHPKASDFADGVHAMYAPYVDFFRADSYMANHIRRCVERHGTFVVPKLSLLVPALARRLSSS